jgi:hypothetical protein
MFQQAAFDTTTLDRELAARGGQPFREPAPESVAFAVLGAALESFARAGRRPSATGPGGAGSRWQQVARRDALR